MTRLRTELQRLFDLTEAGFDPTPGPVRCLWIELARPADWAPLRALWTALQTALDLPAPAIAVSGQGGLQLWLPLAQPVPRAEAAAFLAALCRTHLPGHAELRPGRLRCWPDAAGTLPPPAPVPAPVTLQVKVQGNAGDEPRWSAFVTPDLPAVFGEDAWLDLPPGDDAQADLLSRIQTIAPAAWAAACARLGLHGANASAAVAPATVAPPVAAAPAAPAHATTPVAFLRAVMNDAQAPLALRVEAARALLAAGLGDTA